MPTGSNLDLKMDPLPIPDDAPVQQAQEKGQQDLARKNQLPPGAGFASKGSQYAHFADSILTGWMAGRHTKQVKELEKAKGDVTSSRSIYDSLAQTYRSNIASGKDKDDPEMKKAAADISAAWGNYVNTADKYSTPDDQKEGGKKKGGAKQKAAKMFGFDIEPEMFRKGSVDILRKSGPPVLGESMSSQDQAAKLGLDEAKKESTEREEKRTTRSKWEALSMIDPKQRTPEQEKELAGIERKMLGPESKEQQVKEQFYTDIGEASKSGKPLDPAKTKLYQDMGLMQKDNPSISTIVDKQGHVQMIAVSPDGKSVVTTQLKGANGQPLQERIPEDQVSAMKRIHDFQFNQSVKDFETAYADQVPDKNELHQQATKFALAKINGFKSYGTTPVEAEQNMFKLSGAIHAVMSESSKADKELYKNFFVIPANDTEGVYAYRTNIVDPQTAADSSWFGLKKTPAKYYGGATIAELPAKETEARTKLLTALRHKFPKMSDDQVRKMMPQKIDWGSQPQQPPQMSAPPESSGARAQGDPPRMEAPPASQKSYAAHAVDSQGRDIGFNTQTKQWELEDQE